MGSNFGEIGQSVAELWASASAAYGGIGAAPDFCVVGAAPDFYLELDKYRNLLTKFFRDSKSVSYVDS
jgi:hypothetical protein